MELLTNHLQVFVSVIVILGAAGVALVCDLLKSNNEHLREENTELRVRATLTPAVAAAATPAPVAQLPVAPRTQAAIAAPPTAEAPVRLPVAAAETTLQRGAALTSRRGSRPAAGPAVEAPGEQLPGASLAEARLLAREFIGRSSERKRNPATALPETPQQPEIMAEKAAPAAAASSNRQRPVQRKDWSTLLNKRKSAPTVDLSPQAAAAEAPAAKPRMAELIPFETIQNNGDLAIPAGFHEGMMLARILNSEKTMRGLVVVVGINDFAARRNNTGNLGAEALAASVSDHIRSILRPGDFACQSSEDEFLMICPNERDGGAQRRLGEIAETLWDYQLRSVGTSVILFSWGGVEAKGESFADVFAAAAERMRETRRSRRGLSLEAPRRKAV